MKDILKALIPLAISLVATFAILLSAIGIGALYGDFTEAPWAKVAAGAYTVETVRGCKLVFEGGKLQYNSCEE